MSQRFLVYAPLGALLPAEVNPKLHDIPSLIASLVRFGFVSAAIVDERTGRLAAGHGRRLALIDMRDQGMDPPGGIFVDDDGDWLMPVQRGWASRDDAEAMAYIIGDNQLTIAGGWHMKSLASMVEDVLGDDPSLIEVMGFTSDDIDSIIRRGASDSGGDGAVRTDDLWDDPERPRQQDDVIPEGNDGGPVETIDHGRTHVCPACGFESTTTRAG